MREPSQVKDVHRDLFLDRGNFLRGDDVRALQSATGRRLDSRNIERPLSVDGIFGERTAAAVDTAAYFLGVLADNVQERQVSERMQEIIRNPGTREPGQLERARQRLDALEKDRREAREREKRRKRKDKGRTDKNRIEARRLALNAFRLTYTHRGAVHYTQGAARWQGINNDLKAFKGQYPRYADCSSLYTWALWNAFDHFGWSDSVNGTGWRAGYTGTLLTHGKRVSSLLPGDAIFYGRGWPGTHVTMYVGNGLCYSHGSEAGPYLVSYRYRSDIMQFRRYI
jgi:hypothetical protein